MGDDEINGLPVERKSIGFKNWKITTQECTIFQSICCDGKGACPKDLAEYCEFCTYRYAAFYPILPEMMYHKNRLTLNHSGGASLQFKPLDVMKFVDMGSQELEIEDRDYDYGVTEEEILAAKETRPHDWTFTTNYKGTLNEKFRIEETDKNLELNNQGEDEREALLFHKKIDLFTDELEDRGLASCCVQIDVRPSGFFVLLRYFLRIDNEKFKINGTRYYFENDNDYIIQEYTEREASYGQLKNVSPELYNTPDEIEKHLPLKMKQTQKLFFK